MDKVSVLQIARVKSFLNLSTTLEIERMLWYDIFLWFSGFCCCCLFLKKSTEEKRMKQYSKTIWTFHLVIR